MREIKFRAWNKKQKRMEWIQPRDFAWLGENALQEVNDYEVMQYTGLKDAQGKEIYEGDIVDHGDNFSSVVFWDVCGFAIRELGTVNDEKAPREHEFPNSYTFKPSVIGNIYENPELLNKTI